MTGDVKTKVAVGRNATVPLIGVLFEIVDLCQGSRVHDAGQILCPPETNSLPTSSIEQNDRYSNSSFLIADRGQPVGSRERREPLAHTAISSLPLEGIQG